MGTTLEQNKPYNPSNPSIALVKSKAEIEEVAKLAAQIWKEHYTDLIGESQVTYMLDKFQSVKAITDQRKHGAAYFTINDKGIVGYFSIIKEAEFLFISKFYLLKDHRRHGYGKEMMRFIEDYADKTGLKKLRLTVNKGNEGSILAYNKMGFVKSKEVVFNIGECYFMDDFEMVKKL